MLSGLSTKGTYAYPSCGKDTRSKWLDNGHKYCYTCHRRFLPLGHKLHRDKVSFDGAIEMKIKKASMTITDILSELDSVATEYKKEDLRKQRRAEYEKESEEHIWKKKSIFFELPYWSDNLIRHNLDVMHIEKDKSNIKLPLHQIEKGSDKYYLPPAPFTLGKRDDILQDFGKCQSTRWLLPLATRRSLAKNVVDTLIELDNFFIKLCSKIND
ncbi:UNVERIFIED_CONTAM: hypothetical protein Slati_4480600 [Sesamum latifolium]|uniref:Uncharacterized protein n=1 Tax=Sesamum latifolium TaxID=2727402 RepID=A0AAW2SRV5_9LAMI